MCNWSDKLSKLLALPKKLLKQALVNVFAVVGSLVTQKKQVGFWEQTDLGSYACVHFLTWVPLIALSLNLLICKLKIIISRS